MNVTPSSLVKILPQVPGLPPIYWPPFSTGPLGAQSLLYPEEDGSRFLRNAAKFLSYYMPWHLKRQ